MKPEMLFDEYSQLYSLQDPDGRGIVAYFSMEIAINPLIPTYSGGLGVLAGDTLRAAADMGLHLVALTLAHRKGYFKQHLDANGMQAEEDQPWDLEGNLTPEEPVVTVFIEDGQTKTDRSIYLLGYSLHSRVLRSAKVELEGLSLLRRGVGEDLQKAVDAAWDRMAPAPAKP